VKLIDRMLLRGFMKSGVVCFVCLISLYLVIDLFNKLDEFMDASDGTLGSLLKTMGAFYLYQVVLIFDRLCGVIILLAAMFTVAWLQRNNELLPLLSAGIPTRRVLRPVFVGTLALLALSTANRELLMPRVAEQLQNPANDPRGEKVRAVHGAYEPNGILISGQRAYKQGMIVHHFTCTVPEKVAGTLYHITAREARYVPPGPQQPSGGWLLTETTPTELPPGRIPQLDVLDPGKFFLRTERVTFDLVTRSRAWYQYASTWEIFLEMQEAGSARQASMAVQLHLRLTLPLLTILLVLMGLAVILRDQNRNVFISAGLCLVLAAVFYGVCYACKHLGENEYLSAPLAAWLPVLLFGPLALNMFDGIHT
jgi:lipopolysaccharide export system permease protein